MRMLNFPQLEPDSACMSLVRRGVTALITESGSDTDIVKLSRM
jgi:hypothetical protein